MSKCPIPVGNPRKLRNLGDSLGNTFCFVLSFYYVFLLLSPSAKAYLVAVSLDHSASPCAFRYDRVTCHITRQFYFCCVLCSNPRQKLENLTSYILWACGRPQWRRFHLLLCIVTYLLLLRDPVWHLGDEMIWQCLQCFQNISFQKLPSTLFIFSFLCTFFWFNFWLVCQIMACKDFQMTWLQYPLPGFFLITGIPFCNPYLMKALAKSTTEIKAVKLVTPHPFGKLKIPSNPAGCEAHWLAKNIKLFFFLYYIAKASVKVLESRSNIKSHLWEL